MPSSNQTSFRQSPAPTTTTGETVYEPDDPPPGIVVWASLWPHRTPTEAQVKDFARNPALANLETFEQCRSEFDIKCRTANSLRSDHLKEWWDRAVVEVTERIRDKKGVRVLVCDNETDYKAAKSRIPASTLDHPKNYPYTPTPKLEEHSPTYPATRAFPTDAVPDIVICVERDGDGETSRAATKILHAACKPALRQSGDSETFLTFIDKQEHIFPRAKIGQSQSEADMVVFQGRVEDAVGRVHRHSNVPITVCYPEADYALTMERNPDLVVVEGHQRDALAFLNLKQGFAGHDGHESDPGRYSDDGTNYDEGTADGESTKCRRISG
jgi:hypothetical protein